LPDPRCAANLAAQLFCPPGRKILRFQQDHDKILDQEKKPENLEKKR